MANFIDTNRNQNMPVAGVGVGSTLPTKNELNANIPQTEEIKTTVTPPNYAQQAEDLEMQKLKDRAEKRQNLLDFGLKEMDKLPGAKPVEAKKVETPLDKLKKKTNELEKEEEQRLSDEELAKQTEIEKEQNASDRASQEEGSLPKQELVWSGDENGNWQWEKKGAYGEGNLYDDIKGNTLSTESTSQKLHDISKDVVDQLEKTEVPNTVKTSIKDILSDPSMRGKALPYILDVLANAGYAATTKQQQGTALGQINAPLNQQFAEDSVRKNKAITSAQIEPQEAAIKEFTDLELRLRDTTAGTYIDRYNASQDAETKKQVLEQMVRDASVWANMDWEQKIDMLSYIQALDGSGSLLSMAIQEYAPQLMEKLDEFIKGRKITKADIPSEEGEESPTIIDFKGNSISQKEIDDNPNSYMTIPSRDGKSVVIVKKNQNFKTTAEERADFYKEILNNPQLEAEGEDRDAVRKSLIKEYVDNSLMSPTHALQEFQKFQKERDQFEKQQKDNALAVQTAGEKAQNTLDSFKDNGKSAQTNLKLLQNDSNLLANLQKANNPVLNKKYNDLVNEYSVKIATEGLDKITTERTNLASEKLKNIEKWEKENASLLSLNPALMQDVENRKEDLRMDEQFREPLAAKVNQNVANFNHDGRTYELKEDGTFSIRKTVGGQAFYDVINPKTYNDPKSEYTMKMLNFALNNGSIDGIYNLIDPERNMTEEAIKLIGRNSAAYNFLKNIVGNKELYDYAQKHTDTDVSKKYFQALTAFNQWL